MADKYFTAVFKVVDSEEFKSLSGKITESLANESEFFGAVVTGCGWGDSMSEAEALEEILRDENLDHLIP